MSIAMSGFRRRVLAVPAVLVVAAVIGTCAFTNGGGSGGTTLPAGLTLAERDEQLLTEHVYGGPPSAGYLHIRNGYVLCYNPATRTPKWVAYHVKPAYRDAPARTGRFATFRADPDVANQPSDAEYVGLLASRGYARGHLAPYAVMGGDRDPDGRSAKDGDEDDVLTVFQVNCMSNIAPQHQAGFNGDPGLWYNLERWVQDDVVKDGCQEAWVFAGCVFGPGEHEKVGPKADIWVPPMFYQIVILKKEGAAEPIVLAFLLPHQRKAHGRIQDFMVSVDVVEALAGVDFFPGLPDDIERRL